MQAENNSRMFRKMISKIYGETLHILQICATEKDENFRWWSR